MPRRPIARQAVDAEVVAVVVANLRRFIDRHPGGGVRVIEGKIYRHPAFAWIEALARGEAIEAPGVYLHAVLPTVQADRRYVVAANGRVAAASRRV